MAIRSVEDIDLHLFVDASNEWTDRRRAALQQVRNPIENSELRHGLKLMRRPSVVASNTQNENFATFLVKFLVELETLSQLH